MSKRKVVSLYDWLKAIEQIKADISMKEISIQLGVGISIINIINNLKLATPLSYVMTYGCIDIFSDILRC